MIQKFPLIMMKKILIKNSDEEENSDQENLMRKIQTKNSDKEHSDEEN